MDERKLIGGWAVAMLILAGGVFAWYRFHSVPPVDTNPDPAAATTTEEEDFGPKLGSKMPELTGEWLTSDSKKPETVGRVVLLDVWSTFCGPCVASIPENNKFIAKYREKGLTFIGVAAQTRAVLEQFKKSVTVQYPLLATQESTLGTLKISFFPTTLLFNKQGVLVWKGSQLERDGALLPDFEKILDKSLNDLVLPEKAENAAPEFPPEFAKLVEQAKVTAAATAPEELLGTRVGQALPPLKGAWLTADGKTPDLKGKCLVVECWTTVCGTCVESIPQNNAFAKKCADLGIVFVGATPEDAERVSAFQKRTLMGYPVLCDCESFYKDAVVEALPATFVVGRDGKLLWRGEAFQLAGKLEPEFEKAVATALTIK